MSQRMEDAAIDRIVSMTIGDDKATFLEMYGRGGINREANGARRDLNVTGLETCDAGWYAVELSTRETGVKL